jgi:transporter family-2 protein
MTVAAFILIAFVNGMVVGTTRAINGQLNTEIGPFKASLWNHVVGFLFLTIALLVIGEMTFDFPSVPPLPAYLGGFFGALFVAVSSYVFPRLGAMNAALMVISGQMIAAVLIDFASHGVAPSAMRWLGVAIVLFGMYMARVSNSAREKDRAK